MLVPLQDGPHGERVVVRPLEDGLLALQDGWAGGAEAALEIVHLVTANSRVAAIKPLQNRLIEIDLFKQIHTAMFRKK